MKIGVIQITSSLEPEENLGKISLFLDRAKNEKAEAVFLPECFYSMSDGTKSTPYLVENGNEHYQKIANLAREKKITILGGSAATVNPSGGLPLNRSYHFDEKGNDLGHYDKIHLFSCDLSRHSSKKVINESDIYSPGKNEKVIAYNEMSLGVGICFDLRFPEMWRILVKAQKINTLSFSSAFTVPTGKAHWHTLLRARAIENQCYVVASAQWGKNNEKIQTYGHSLIIDPWGKILADAEEGEKIIFSELDFSYVEECRSRLTVLVD